jgi:hypothetical protein
MKSYITLYQNEVRAVEITIRDEKDLIWEPDTAYFSIIDSNGTVVLDEATAMVQDNKVFAIFPSSVSATCGSYDIIWKIEKEVNPNTYVYYHKTNVVVEEL